MRRIFVIFIYLVFGAISIFSIPAVIQQHQAMRSYQPVSMVVRSSRIERTGSRGNRFSVRIQYEYVVSHARFTSARVFPIDRSDGPLSMDRDEAQELVDRYPADSFHTAYYDPANPIQSFIERKVLFFPYMGVIYASAFWSGLAQWVYQGARWWWIGRDEAARERGVLPTGHVTFVVLLVSVFAIAGHYLWLSNRNVEWYAVAFLDSIIAVFAIAWFVRWRNARRTTSLEKQT